MPEDGLYRYLLQPGEEHDDQCKRKQPIGYGLENLQIERNCEDSGNCVMYYLKDGPGRAFVKEELMLIPEDTESPPSRLCLEIMK